MPHAQVRRAFNRAHCVAARFVASSARTVADGTVCGAQQIMLRRQPKTVDRAVRAPRIATTGILAMLK
ncbi:hypothetical protein LGN11_15150 [Burkholderia multivorans]|nr:hypothetical protein [Burkholderia multivorans]